MAAESIYAWVAPPPPPVAKDALYHSRHAGAENPWTALIDPFSVTSTSGSIGRDLEGAVSPRHFLRAHSGRACTSAGDPSRDGTADGGAANRTAKSKNKPAVPSRVQSASSSPGKGGRSTRDYLTENAVAAMLAAPQRPHNSRDDANWLARPGFGEVPGYLSGVKVKVVAEQAERQREEDAKKAAEEALLGHKLTSQEREDLLVELQQRWDRVNHAYQKMTHKRISTASSIVSEIRAKETCERQLSLVEAEMAKLRAPGPIYMSSIAFTAPQQQ